MSRWDQRTEGPPRVKRGDEEQHRRDDEEKCFRRSRSRSRSSSPVERRLRQLDEERRRKERELRQAAHLEQQHTQKRLSDNSSSDDSNEAPTVGSLKPKIGFGFQKPSAGLSNPGGGRSAMGFQFQQNSNSKSSAIQLKLGTAPKKETPKLLKPVANAFANDDSDDEPEEMPAECRMRMRNIGRETPTSSGPNSFGKTKQGFCDSKKILEKQLNSLADS
ncbi:PEST proteolytic signal-containing nuclear protein-like isoform X3 [Uranotaenia lowii]|uniref:PEST proteolytic signal-containing nuclear protein-like isoform X3 n=1 Tax=Uranotaenia lowii TaxID=190385 RepID=UPI00247ABCC8|nr:PEST proteolytic signal-containing nuclear protein-like isoform X3 [Uranotaenia lowii]